ncbi:MAG: PIN domain-containing protein [Candidatus Sumerlaeota bacterium]|nr:PIN domain-containing protein [Candidatus Sumerlaeota bacterium]
MTDKHKETVYLDTTILSYLFDERESVKTLHKITEKWWKEESQRYGIYTSRDTFAELRNGEYPRKKEVIDFAGTIAECAHVPIIDDIVAQYIQDTLMPNDAHGDAYHLAYASYYNIDYLLTWNCEHLANANKAKHIEVINHRLGLATPTIVTPMQLFLER